MEACIVLNFKVYEISRGTHKLFRKFTLIKKKKSSGEDSLHVLHGSREWDLYIRIHPHQQSLSLSLAETKNWNDDFAFLFFSGSCCGMIRAECGLVIAILMKRKVQIFGWFLVKFLVRTVVAMKVEVSGSEREWLLLWIVDLEKIRGIIIFSFIFKICFYRVLFKKLVVNWENDQLIDARIIYHLFCDM